MNTKLTLSLDSKVIEEAKKYSGKKGVSLSKIIEEYLVRLTSPRVKKRKPSIKELRGILGDAPSDFDYKKEVREYLYEKHVRK